VVVTNEPFLRRIRSFITSWNIHKFYIKHSAIYANNCKHYDSKELSGNYARNLEVINSFENLFTMRFAHVWSPASSVSATVSSCRRPGNILYLTILSDNWLRPLQKHTMTTDLCCRNKQRHRLTQKTTRWIARNSCQMYFQHYWSADGRTQVLCTCRRKLTNILLDTLLWAKQTFLLLLHSVM
jgi:hypothetical protein